MLTLCPHCGGNLYVLPGGLVTTPEVITATITRHHEVLRYEDLLKTEEGRQLLAEEVRSEDLGAAFDLLDEQTE